MPSPTLPKTIEDAILLTLGYVGVPKLTKDNVKKVYLRSKQLQYLQNGPGFFVYDEPVDSIDKDGNTIKVIEQRSRMPYLEELNLYIGLAHKDIESFDDKKWNKMLIDHITKEAKAWIEQEEQYLAALGKEDETPPEKIEYAH